MNDTQFDNFFNDKFRDHAVPVPAGLWDKVVEGQLDKFIGSKLKDAEAPVPDGLWEKIGDTQFDNFVAGTLSGNEAPVPTGLWDKITDGQFDSFVAGKLKDHEAPVPAGLWEKVKPGEDDDRVGFFWFRYPAAAVLILGLLAAGALGSYFYFTAKEAKDAAAVTVTPIGNNKENTQLTAPEKQLQSEPRTGSGTQDAGNANSHPLNTEAATGDLKKTPGFDKSGSPAVNNNVSKTQGANPVTEEAATHSGANEASVLSTRRKKGIDLSPADPRIANDLTNSTYNIFTNKANTSNNILTDGMDEMGSYQQRGLLNGATVPFDLANYNLLLSLKDKQLSTINHTNQFRNIIICPADRNRNTDWYLEAYVSPDMPFKSVTNVSATPLYLAKKDSSESMQVSYSAGLRLVKPITDNILLKAGLQYSQANEKYVYRTENEVKTTTVVTVRTIIRAPGDTVIVQDTSVLQTIGFRNNTVKNRYRSFDIPVTIGYQFGNDDLKIGINAGVAVNLSSWYQGVILDSSLATVTLNKTGNSVYKTNIGLGLLAGVSVVKRLSDDMHVFFEPYFRYNLSSMTTSQASFKQRLSVGGLAIGLRVNLNRK
ncbi:MAG: hypothetical protein V4450_08050 [Bacteroidota bacterium]